MERQQTDRRVHRLLCRQFALLSKGGFESRPSDNHRLGIFLPMTSRKPSLVWIESRKDEDKPGLAPYEHLEVGHLMQIPGNEGYIGRSLLDIRGNALRGRERNEDAIFV